MPANLDPAAIPLRDIHLPPPPAWWPPAPGWWLVGCAVLVAPPLLWLWWRRRRARALRRSALRELARLRTLENSPGALAIEAGLLLRRISLALDPARRHVAATGAAWLARVRAIAPGFEDEALAAALLRAPYAAAPEFDAAALLAALERWIQALPNSRRRLRELAAAPPRGA